MATASSSAINEVCCGCPTTYRVTVRRPLKTVIHLDYTVAEGDIELTGELSKGSGEARSGQIFRGRIFIFGESPGICL
jgi:hypothetical protein